MEPITPYTPQPGKRLVAANQAETAEGPRQPSRSRETEAGTDVDARLAFLALLGAPLRPAAPTRGQAGHATALAGEPASAVAIARRPTLVDDAAAAPDPTAGLPADSASIPPIPPATGPDVATGAAFTATEPAPARPAIILPTAELPTAGLAAAVLSAPGRVGSGLVGSGLVAPTRAEPETAGARIATQDLAGIRSSAAATGVAGATLAASADPAPPPVPTPGAGKSVEGSPHDAGREAGQAAEKPAPTPRSDLAVILRYPAPQVAAGATGATAAMAAEPARSTTDHPAAARRNASPQRPEATATDAAANAPARDSPALPSARFATATPPGPVPPVSGASDGQRADPASAQEQASVPPATARAAGENARPSTAAVDTPTNSGLADRATATDLRPADGATGADTLPAPFAEAVGEMHTHARLPAHGDGRATTGMALPPGLGHHLAEVAARFPDRPVELTLSPEELGRVRMTFSSGDGALTMTLVADRPETLDLLRRHIDVLAQDFRDLGFANLTFSFAQGGDSSRPEAEVIAETDRPAEAAPTPMPDDRATAQAGTGGLDLRL